MSTSKQPAQSPTERKCTRCGKGITDTPYEYWLFHTCKHCAIDGDGRFKRTGTYRKWKYYPIFHYDKGK